MLCSWRILTNSNVMDAIALPLLWTMRIKLIFLAEKLFLIAFITVNRKELLYDSVGTQFLVFIVS